MTVRDDFAVAEDLLALLPPLGRVLSESAREAGLSLDRVKPLGMLSRAGPIRAGELAERCHLTPAAVTHAIDMLVADGLVRREDDPADRRAVVLQITQKGRREIARVHQAAMAEIVPVLEELDAPTRAALRQALPKLGAVLARRREAERV